MKKRRVILVIRLFFVCILVSEERWGEIMACGVGTIASWGR